MTPQAKTASDVGITEEQTPVIIKVGGDLVAGNENTPDTLLVSIDSPLMYFDDPGQGPTWETARSTKTGRIIEVSFADGRKPRQDFPIHRSEELVSVRIEYGTFEFVAMESGTPPDNVYLTFTSIGVPFNVKRAEGWKTATAYYPPITRVIIMQGSTLITDYPFEHPDNVDLNVQFYVNLIQ